MKLEEWSERVAEASRQYFVELHKQKKAKPWVQRINKATGEVTIDKRTGRPDLRQRGLSHDEKKKIMKKACKKVNVRWRFVWDILKCEQNLEFDERIGTGLRMKSESRISV